MPTQPCFEDCVVPKDAIHHMCPNDNNNIPMKEEKNKQQERLPVGADVLQRLFHLQEILLCNAPCYGD